MTTKKTSAKPEKTADKKPAKKPGKRADTSPAEKPAEKKPPKAKKGAREPERTEEPAPAPERTEQPAPVPAPAPPPVPASTATVLADDPSRDIDGKSLYEKGKYLLSVCPKAKESPALSCISLKGHVAAATDERSCLWVDFGCAVTASPIKVTRSSFDAFMALLDGELKAAEKLDASVVVRWDGLVATIRREGEPDGRVVLLDRFESGPEADFFFLDAPEFAEGSHATLSIERLRTAATWKGDGDAHVFVSPSARQIWILFDVGGFTFARAIVAFDGSNLGVRQPSLPMDASGRKPAAAPPAEAPAASQPAPEPQVIEPEVVLPAGAPRGLPAGLAWVRVECDRGAAWERLTRQALEMLAPFSVEPGPGGEGGVVVWGPYPRDAARARFVFAYLRSQHLDPRAVPCEAVNLWTRALAQAASAPPLGLDAGGLVAGALPAGGGDGGPAFPAPDTDVCAILGEETWSSLTDAERAALEAIVAWDHNTSDRDRGSHDMAPDVALRLAAAMEAMGLRAAVERVDEEDGSITFWRVRRAPADAAHAAFPEPGERPVVVEIPEALWDELTPDQIIELSTPTKGTVVSWFNGPTSTSSSKVGADEARAIGALLAGWGYRCERAEDATRYGYEVTAWHVGRAGERGAAL